MQPHKPAVTAALSKLEGADEFISLVQTEQIAQNLEELKIQKITSEGQVSVVKQVNTNLKKVIKKISEIRLNKTRNIDDLKKRYIELEKTVIAPLVKAVDHGNQILHDYLVEVEKKSKEEERKLKNDQAEKTIFASAIKDFADETAKGFQSAFKNKSLKEATDVYRDFLSNKNENSRYSKLLASFEERTEEITDIHAKLMIIGKVINYYAKDTLTKASAAEKIKEVMNDLKDKFELDMEDVGEKEESQIQQNDKVVKETAKGTYYKIDWDVSDFSKVPKEFTKSVIDNEAVNQWKKENTKDIVDGKKSIPGIKMTWELKSRG